MMVERLVFAADGPVEPLTYSVAEAARLLGISRSHAYHLIACGEFPEPSYPIRVLRPGGSRAVVPRVALDRYLAGEPASP